VSTGSVARRLDKLQSVPAEIAHAALRKPPAPRQRTLFPQTVLPFDDFAPMRDRGRRTGSATRTTGARRGSRKLRRLEAAGQQRLELETPLPRLAAETQSGVRSAKFCTDAVAPPSHRLMAAIMDLGVVAAAVGVLFAMVHFVIGPAALAELGSPAYAGAVLAVAALYRLLFWLADGDTPGMSWRRLRLLDFSGRRPSRGQRAKRFAGACLSLAAGGLGLLWALGDEEKLCWNDHLSKTFPSPKSDLA